MFKVNNKDTKTTSLAYIHIYLIDIFSRNVNMLQAVIFHNGKGPQKFENRLIMS